MAIRLRMRDMWASDSMGTKAARRVLVVENHVDTRTYLVLCLQECGYEVESAHGMLEALALLKTRIFDVLISDLGLGDGDGWRLLDLAGANRPPYAIAMSGFGTQKDRQKSMDVGYQHHLVKPFSGAELRQLMKEAESMLDATASQTRSVSEHEIPKSL